MKTKDFTIQKSRNRALRSMVMRFFDRHSSLPKRSGGVVAHIVDLDRDASLRSQLLFLAERDLKTYRFYTNRPREVEEIFLSEETLRRTSHAVIDVSHGPPRHRLWPLVDNYNAGLPQDTWSLCLQAGEFLMYPYVGTRTIPDLCKFLFDENRQSFFCLVLDVYAVGPTGPALEAGSGNWAFDRFGYNCRHDKPMQLDRWQGGFVNRFPDFQRAYGRRDLSRVPLIRTGRGAFHTRNLKHALPRKLNLANAVLHLSPTGCILSAQAYHAFEKGGPWQTSRAPLAKLVSAPRIEVDWRHHALAENGFMNLGQWL